MIADGVFLRLGISWAHSSKAGSLRLRRSLPLVLCLSQWPDPVLTQSESFAMRKGLVATQARRQLLRG
jgi:hypothetical protein